MSHQRPSIDELCRQAVNFHKVGALPAAERLYLQILSAHPLNFVACHSLGLVRLEQGRLGEALDLFGAALRVKFDSVSALGNYGLVLQRLRRFELALAYFEKALKIAPDHPDVLHSHGLTLWHLNRFDEALVSYDRAIIARPAIAVVWNNRGNALFSLHRLAEAIASFDQAIALRPDFAEAHYNRGRSLLRVGDPKNALSSYAKAVEINPRSLDALLGYAGALRRLKRLAEALAVLDRALAINPDHVCSLVDRGNLLLDLKRMHDALGSFDRALELDAQSAEAFVGRGNALQRLGRFGESKEPFEGALAFEPSNSSAFNGLASAALHTCDWEWTGKLASVIATPQGAEQHAVGPFLMLGYHDDPEIQFQCAKAFIRSKHPSAQDPLWTERRYRHDRIRIAYLSADFHRHATALLMAGLLERHDRSEFEVFVVSFGADDGSALRARIARGSDRFYDVSSESDQAVAKLLREAEVDIAVDLKGHTANARPGILSYRPCPVQVNYLGYPGTMGADFIDYILADSVVLPFDRQCWFAEKIIQLPHSYQANDSSRPIKSELLSRREAGLPEHAFVFCSFVRHWKITAPIFDIWMRLLAAIPDSILWLIDEPGGGADNLRREATLRGVDPRRLIFAPKMENDAHLARHRLADLFLDTLPYNAHTTASDALWAGLPVLTCCGKGFAARVGASLLYAVGLSEMVTETVVEYERLASRLAVNRDLLQSVRRKLAQNRLTYPLFDTDRFRQGIEAAYKRMIEISDRGDSPQPFRISSGAE